MTDKLTKKQKGFVKDYVETGNGTQSALKNYNTKDYKSASVIATENLDKLSIQNAILSIAERIPDDLLVEKHLALLNKVDKEGDIDVQAVGKGLEMGYRVKGSYAPDKTINVNVEVESSDRIKELAEKLRKLEEKPND